MLTEKKVHIKKGIKHRGAPHSKEPNEELLAKVKKLDEQMLDLLRLEKNNLELEEKIKQLTQQVKQLDSQVFDLLSILQASKVFASNPDINRLGEVLISILAEKLNIQKVALFLYNEKKSHYELIKVLGLPHNLINKVTYHKKEGLFWQLITNGEPFPVVDLQGNLRFPKIFEENGLDKIHSSFWVPLKAKDLVIGFITFDRCNFNSSEFNFISILASQAAVALESAILYTKIAESRQELDRQMHQLTILYDVSKALNYIEDLTKMLTLILDQAIQVIEAEKGSLMLIDEKTDELEVRVVRGIDKLTEERIMRGEIKTTRIKRGEGIAGKVLESGEVRVLNKIEENSGFLASKDSRVESILCVPLKIYNDVIGVINITNKKNGKKFNEEDIKIISALADQAAAAINSARLYEMAVTDSLTKLYIRRHFYNKLDDELRRSRRYGHKLSLLMVDIDHFKKLNDSYGHQAGDAVLVAIARLFRNTIRNTDIVGRYGGEEFCFILPETETSGAIVIAERLRQEVEKLQIPYENIILKTTISLGIATFPTQAHKLEDLIKYADMALYHSKQAGRNRVTAYQSLLPANGKNGNGKK